MRTAGNGKKVRVSNQHDWDALNTGLLHLKTIFGNYTIQLNTETTTTYYYNIIDINS